MSPFLWAVPIGALGGLIGLGGAEFRLPVLVGALGHTARDAVSLNLVVSLATVTAAVAARSGGVPEAMRYAPDLVPLVVGAVLAAFFGAGWARRIPEQQLRRAIFALLALIGAALIVEAFLTRQSTGFLPEDRVIRSVFAFAAGLGIGVFSSVLGVAGGEVIIPTLVFAFGLDIKTAGTASLLVSVPTILAGIGRYAGAGAYRDREPLRSTAVPMSIGSILGAVAGGLAVGIIPSAALKVVLGLVLLWSANRVFREAQ